MLLVSPLSSLTCGAAAPSVFGSLKSWQLVAGLLVRPGAARHESKGRTAAGECRYSPPVFLFLGFSLPLFLVLHLTESNSLPLGPRRSPGHAGSSLPILLHQRSLWTTRHFPAQVFWSQTTPVGSLGNLPALCQFTPASNTLSNQGKC